jgi:tetratricopeptide (TPR) repeat protein
MNEPAAFSTPHILDALQKIHSHRLTGSLSFPYGSGLCTLVVAGGDIVAVDTLTARERLIPFLQERGGDPGDLLAGATQTVSLDQLERVQGLVAEFIGRLVNELANPRLAVLINFQPCGGERTERVRLKGVVLALQVYDQWLDAQVLAALQPAGGARLRVAPDAMGRIRGLPLTSRQGFVLSRLHDGQSVDELVQGSGLPEEQVVRALLALVFLEVLHLAPEAAPQPRGEVPRAETARPAPRPAPPAGPRPRPAPVAPPRPAEGNGPAAVESLPADLKSELDDLSILAGSGNHYDLLGVNYHAETDEIKKRYVELTKRFHPDHFSRFNDPELQSRVDALFARITEAAETLKDPVRRADYNDKHELDKAALKPQGTPAAAEPEKKHVKTHAYEDPTHIAKQHYTHGKEAFNAKKFYDATEHFRQAVRMVPDVAEYQFWLGRTLSLNPQRYKEAEERLQKALALMPDRPEILLELARFYGRVNLPLRAQKYYQRVYELKPDNEEARLALGIKKSSRPTSLKGFLKMDLKDFLKSDKDK